MPEFVLTPGHVILFVRVAADESTTRDDVEAQVVDWLADALDVDASRRSAEGEFVIGAANPVTVIPVLDVTDEELAAREAALCQGRNDAFLGALPHGSNAGALVHIDWAGVPSSLPTRWRHRFGSGLLARWEPTEAVDDVGLAVTAQCAQEDRARPPIEPPGAFDDLDLPEAPKISNPFSSPLTWIGVAAVAVVGFALWQGSKSGRRTR